MLSAVQRYELDGGVKCLVLASDGVWEYMTNQQVVAVVCSFGNVVV